MALYIYLEKCVAIKSSLYYHCLGNPIVTFFNVAFFTNNDYDHGSKLRHDYSGRESSYIG